MKRMIILLSFTLLSAMSVGAQGKTEHEHSTPITTHSNAPAGAHAASKDRDKGKDRADDVGKGKKKGLKKSKKDEKDKKANTSPTDKK